MVALSDDFRRRHSTTSLSVFDLRYVKSRKPHVFKTFLEYSGLDDDHATAVLVLTDSLLFGVIPSVSVAELYTIPGYAKYPGVGDNILLGPGFVDQYEALVGVDDVRGRCPKGLFIEERGSIVLEQRNAKLLMESKLLHELVHWARRNISGLPLGASKGHKGEVGWEFEKSAYGMKLTSSTLGLREYIGDY